ncbi:MAG: hypothetical protein MZV70_25925 [Desulfobacterales bacterium]|nr:hypothetical protein [Desulfobacterales bacterium]
MPLNFLKPSPHGGIQLNNCLIEQKSILGKVGSAWQDIVVPLGEIEDVVMMGPVLGGMAAQLDLLTAAIRENSTSADRALQGEWGALSAFWQTLQTIAYEAAGRLDRSGDSPPLCPLALPLRVLPPNFTPTSLNCPNAGKFPCRANTLIFRGIWNRWEHFKKGACKSVRKKSAPLCSKLNPD